MSIITKSDYETAKKNLGDLEVSFNRATDKLEGTKGEGYVAVQERIHFIENTIFAARRDIAEYERAADMEKCTPNPFDSPVEYTNFCDGMRRAEYGKECKKKYQRTWYGVEMTGKNSVHLGIDYYRTDKEARRRREFVFKYVTCVTATRLIKKVVTVPGVFGISNAETEKHPYV